MDENEWRGFVTRGEKALPMNGNRNGMLVLFVYWNIIRQY